VRACSCWMMSDGLLCRAVETAAVAVCVLRAPQRGAAVASTACADLASGRHLLGTPGVRLLAGPTPAVDRAGCCGLAAGQRRRSCARPGRCGGDGAPVSLSAARRAASTDRIGRSTRAWSGPDRRARASLATANRWRRLGRGRPTWRRRDGYDGPGEPLDPPLSQTNGLGVLVGARKRLRAGATASFAWPPPAATSPGCCTPLVWTGCCRCTPTSPARWSCSTAPAATDQLSSTTPQAKPGSPSAGSRTRTHTSGPSPNWDSRSMRRDRAGKPAEQPTRPALQPAQHGGRAAPAGPRDVRTRGN